jgi:hypothetical protein
MKSLKRALLTLLALWITGLAILYIRHDFYRRVVVHQPMKWIAGNTTVARFRVDLPAVYWLGVEYRNPAVNRVRPADGFSGSFQVKRGEISLLSGTERSLPSSAGPWRIKGDEVTRYLGKFDGRPGEDYEATFRLREHYSEDKGGDPNLIVECDWNFDDVYYLRMQLITRGSIVILAILVIGAITFIVAPKTSA